MIPGENTQNTKLLTCNHWRFNKTRIRQLNLQWASTILQSIEVKSLDLGQLLPQNDLLPAVVCNRHLTISVVSLQSLLLFTAHLKLVRDFFFFCTLPSVTVLSCIVKCQQTVYSQNLRSLCEKLKTKMEKLVFRQTLTSWKQSTPLNM